MGLIRINTDVTVTAFIRQSVVLGEISKYVYLQLFVQTGERRSREQGSCVLVSYVGGAAWGDWCQHQLLSWRTGASPLSFWAFAYSPEKTGLKSWSDGKPSISESICGRLCFARMFATVSPIPQALSSLWLLCDMSPIDRWVLSLSIGAALTSYHRPFSLNNKHLFLCSGSS